MKPLIAKLKLAYPGISFTAGKRFCWSPESKEVFYNTTSRGDKAVWSLLHETGHALLNHTTYQADFQLIRLEVAAWEKARELAEQFTLVIDEDHIQDCLDTYRDWLYKRSICPNCATKSVQQNDYAHYRCFNCQTTWRVTASRFCRAYRSTKRVTQSKNIFDIADL